MDIPSSTSDRMLDDAELERQDRTFAASGQAAIPEATDPDVALAAGDCPWCDAGGFERPEMHARQKHKSEWEAYRDA